MIGIADDDDVEGPSQGDSPFNINDELEEGIVVYLKPDFCDTW